MPFFIAAEGVVDQGVALFSNDRVSFQDALTAWFESNFERCLSYCDALNEQGDESREASLLRARSLLRLDRATAALHVLERMPPDDDLSDLELTRRMLTAAARVRLGDTERALRELLCLRTIMTQVHPSIQSEILMNVGLAHYALRDLDAADAALEAVSATSDIIHARALEHKGWVASARGDHAAAMSLFKAALTRLDECRYYDRFLEANCLQAMATLAVDGLDGQNWIMISSRRAKLRFQVGEANYPLFRLALSAATFENDIAGRPVEAAIEARRASEIAPTEAYRVQALCKRAGIARCAGERVAQSDHLDAAVDAFNNLDVTILSGDERLVVLGLAEELANTGRAAEARTHFETYRGTSATPATLAVTGDARRATYEQLVEAQIYEGEGRLAEAITLYEEALERSVTSSLHHAVIAAIRLGGISGDDRHLRAYTALAARDVKASSWIHAAFKEMGEKSILAKLSAVQSEYLRLICRGYTNPQIAAVRGRSTNTVRNQISVLFETFGVHSRSELIAACVRLGCAS